MSNYFVKRNFKYYWQKVKVNFFSYSKISSAFGWAVKFIITVFILVTIYNVVSKKYFDDKYYLQRFIIPESLEKQGLTGSIVSKFIIKHLNKIDKKISDFPESDASASLRSKFRLDIQEETDVEYEGLSYRSLISFFAPNKNEINGEIIKSDNDLLTVFVSIDGEKYDFNIDFEDSLKLVDQSILISLSIAQNVVARLYPLEYAIYRYLNEDEESCIETIENIIYFNESDKYETLYYLLGLCYVQLDESFKAINNFKKVIHFNPENYKAYGKICEEYLQLGRTNPIYLDSCMLYLQKQVGIVSGNDKVNNLIHFGNYYVAKNHLDSAIYYYRSSISLDSNEYAGYINLASCMAAQYNYDSASIYFSLYENKFPEHSLLNSPYRTALGFNLDSTEFITRATKLFKSGNEYKYGFFAIGQFLYENNQDSLSFKMMSKCLSMDSTFGDALFMQAMILKKYDPFAANQFFQKAYENIWSEDIIEQWSDNLFSQNDIDNALNKLNKLEVSSEVLTRYAFTVQNDYPKVAQYLYLYSDYLNTHNFSNLLHFSDFWITQKKYTKAIFYSNRVLEIDSTNQDAKNNIEECIKELNRK